MVSIYAHIAYAEAERVQRQALGLPEFGGGGGSSGRSHRCGIDLFVNIYVYIYRSTYIYIQIWIHIYIYMHIDISIYLSCNFVSYISSYVPYLSFYLYVYLAIYVCSVYLCTSHTPKLKGCKGKHSYYLSLGLCPILPSPILYGARHKGGGGRWGVVYCAMVVQ